MWISSCALWDLVVLYGVSVVLFVSALRWNLGDRKLAIIVFVKV